MKEATDYAGPPIAVRRRRRRRFNREVANVNLNATENRVGIVLQMTDVFAFEKLLLRMIVGDLLTIKVQYFACVGKYRLALMLKCQLQMSLNGIFIIYTNRRKKMSLSARVYYSNTEL